MTTYDEYVEARLSTYRQGWEEAGAVHSLWEAVFFCSEEPMPLPKWVARGVLDVLANLRGTEPERVRHLQNYKHTHRWKLVKELRRYSHAEFQEKFDVKRTWINTFDTVAKIEVEEEYWDAVAFSDLEEGVEKVRPREPVTAEAIKASYQLVERALKANKLGRFAANFYAPGDRDWVKK